MCFTQVFFEGSYLSEMEANDILEANCAKTDAGSADGVHKMLSVLSALANANANTSLAPLSCMKTQINCLLLTR